MKNIKFITYEGTIEEITAKQKITYTKDDGTEGFFMKQKIIVKCALGDGEWMRMMSIPFEVNAKKLKEIEGYSVGEDVKVSFFIKANNGFVSLTLSKIERAGSNQGGGYGAPMQDDDGNDPLPF